VISMPLDGDARSNAWPMAHVSPSMRLLWDLLSFLCLVIWLRLPGGVRRESRAVADLNACHQPPCAQWVF
jgi:hypothetical protein